MKILMLGWELPPANSGGLGVACYHLCRHLADAGVAIDFVMPYTLPTDHDVTFMRVFSTSSLSPHADGAFGPYANWAQELRQQQATYKETVRALLETNTYDAIHAHDWLTLEAGVFAKQYSGKPLIAHVHSTEFDRCGQTSGNPLIHEIEATCLLMADRIVAVSNITKNILVERYSLPAEIIDTVYNAGSPTTATSDDANVYRYLSRMKQHGYKVVVGLGRLTIQKGFSYFLRAAQRAIQLNSKLIFLLVGDGEQRDELIKLSAELGIAGNVIFTGFLRGKKWRDAYAIGDMFVMSSVSEPFGLTALEAAGAGTAVILTKQSGVSEILRSSLQFDFWDTDRCADYIVNAAEQSALRQTLSHNATQELAHISWQNTAKKVTGLYAQLTGAAV